MSLAEEQGPSVNARGKDRKYKGEGMIAQMQAGINGKWEEVYTDGKHFQGCLMKGAQINGEQRTLAWARYTCQVGRQT